MSGTNTRADATAIGDIAASLRIYRLAGLLGWQDIRQRYRRSRLGPFWLTISMGVAIGALGFVFGSLFSAPMEEFLPFLTMGIILWGYIGAAINEGCSSFIAAEGMIKQLPLPLFTHVMRVLWRNSVIMLHNLVILPLVLLFFLHPIGWTASLAIPGYLVLTLNLSWMALLLGILCTRYRDLPQIVGSLLQVVFYLTPILWQPAQLLGRAPAALLELNPFHHLIELVRAPLLGSLPEMRSWYFGLGLALAGWLLALSFHGRYRRRIAYWL